VKKLNLNAPHLAGLSCFVLALCAHGFAPAYPAYAPLLSLAVYALTALGAAILGSTPAWFSRLEPEAVTLASELPTLPELVPSVPPKATLVKLPPLPPLQPAAMFAFVLCTLCVALSIGCAAFAKDEPVVAADVTKAIDEACAADALAGPIATGLLTPSSPVSVALAAVKGSCPLVAATDAELTAFVAALLAKHATKLADAGEGG
jgi:hypothetical protein